MSKEVAFELEGEEEFLIDVDYYYYFRAARLSGPPEELESEITLPADIAERVKRFALDVMVPRWIKSIETQVQNMDFDNKPAQWSEEDREAAEESRASDRYDDLQYEKLYGGE
jgi:hypothetical protein